MTSIEAAELFTEVLNGYSEIKEPKYRNADIAKLNDYLGSLHQLKEFLEGNREYNSLINGLSQAIKRIEKISNTDMYRITTERGINRAILPVINKPGHPIEYPFEWNYLNTNQTCIINKGCWDANNSMVMDAIGDMFLIKEGGDVFPKDACLLFEDVNSIWKRESAIARDACEPNTVFDIEAVERQRYWIQFTDADFRKFTGKDFTSNHIKELLHETANVEFKLVFPVRMKNGRKFKDKIYQMNYFSRFYEFSYIDEDIRNDGIVKSRRYYIVFNTMLGELYIHNLLARNYDLIDKRLYMLPQNAQMLYKHFILNNNLDTISINLFTIKERLHLYDDNITNLTRTVESNILDPLKQYGYISSYEKDEGLKGMKYVIRVPDKCKPVQK
jgi:hypothetical protein